MSIYEDSAWYVFKIIKFCAEILISCPYDLFEEKVNETL